MFEGSDLGKHRVYTFLTTNKSTLLKVLPPTETAYEQHLKRAALTTAINKSAHICKPNVEPCEDYGWTVAIDAPSLATADDARSCVAAPRVVVETAQVRRRTLSVQFRHRSALAQCRHVHASSVVRQTGGLKLNVWKYPVIHTNYITSQSTTL